jgi:putative phosphoesterase
MQRVEYDAVLCCGDIVVDFPFPEQCIDSLKDTCTRICTGNNDYNVAFDQKASDCVGEKYAHLSDDLDSATDITRELLSDGARKYLQKLPRECRFDLDGFTFYMNHTGPGMSLHHYMDVDTPVSELDRIYRDIRADVCITGHTHIPYVRKFRDGLLVNPGSVGEPRDGDPRASFATFNTFTGQVVLGRLEYDIAETSKALQEMNFPDYSIYCLENGRLPASSEDA